MVDEIDNAVKLILGRYLDPEIENLGFVRPFTNSERLSLACTRSYTLEYIEEFKTDGINVNFAYGSCWHSFLEEVLLEVQKTDVFPTNKEIKWMLETRIDSVIEDVFKEYKTDDLSHSEVTTLKDSIKTRMDLSIEGWAENWRRHIHPNYQVVGVEMIVTSPASLNGETFQDKTMVLREQYLSDKQDFKYKYIYRLLRSGENIYAQDIPPDCISSELYEIEMPYYKVGKIDALLLHREYNSLWILDHKTTKSPAMYEKKTAFDLQLSGYCSLIRHKIKQGDFEHLSANGPIFVGGVVWDICSSDITESKVPKPLKSGKFSTSSSRCPPSWVFKRTIEEHGFNLDDYQEFYETCKSKDDRFFIIKEVFISESEMDRIEAENYATAQQISRTRKQIENIDWDLKYDWDLKSPRYSICTNYASCKFSTNCFANSRSNDIFLPRQQKMSWIQYK